MAHPPPPLGPRTTITFQVAGSLCADGPLTVQFTGYLLSMMQSHFSDPGNLLYPAGWEEGKPGLSAFVWQGAAANPENRGTVINPDSTIFIETVGRYSPAVVQQRPALLLKRDDWTNVKLAISDGQDIRSRQRKGSHTWLCISRSQDEAELLGSEVHDWYDAFGQNIRQLMKLSNFDVGGIGGPVRMDEYREHWVVPVKLTYTASVSWKVNPEGRPLKTVSIDLRP